MASSAIRKFKCYFDFIRHLLVRGIKWCWSINVEPCVIMGCRSAHTSRVVEICCRLDKHWANYFRNVQDQYKSIKISIKIHHDVDWSRFRTFTNSFINPQPGVCWPKLVSFYCALVAVILFWERGMYNSWKSLWKGVFNSDFLSIETSSETYKAELSILQSKRIFWEKNESVWQNMCVQKGAHIIRKIVKTRQNPVSFLVN